MIKKWLKIYGISYLPPKKSHTFRQCSQIDLKDVKQNKTKRQKRTVNKISLFVSHETKTSRGWASSSLRVKWTPQLPQSNYSIRYIKYSVILMTFYLCLSMSCKKKIIMKKNILQKERNHKHQEGWNSITTILVNDKTRKRQKLVNDKMQYIHAVYTYSTLYRL